VNIPNSAIGGRRSNGRRALFGMLGIGWSLMDDGHDVAMIDGARGRWSQGALVDAIVQPMPDAVVFVDTDASLARPVIGRVAARVAEVLPRTRIVYAGVSVRCFWREILDEEPYVDAVLCSAGGEPACQLMRALQSGAPLDVIPGIAFREGQWILGTPREQPTADLQTCSNA
jgi:anaerobic magnesium-protoporphyrin IX monomethyl ester cyclase